MMDHEIHKANVAQVKERLSAYMAMAERGERVVVCRRNKPAIEFVPVQPAEAENRTTLGSAAGSVTIKTDLTEPALSESDWEAL